MQSILAARDLMVALGVLAATGLAAAARADNGMGNGRKTVVLDFEHCEARVTGDTPVAPPKTANGGLFAGMRRIEELHGPAEATDERRKPAAATRRKRDRG